jgi:hypothetical protein
MLLVLTFGTHNANFGNREAPILKAVCALVNGLDLGCRLCAETNGSPGGKRTNGPECFPATKSSISSSSKQEHNERDPSLSFRWY